MNGQRDKLAEQIQFSHIHTFKYAIRNGTDAAHLKDQVPECIKN
jgi:tRNA A37 methylthiotransferase MiaB